MLNRHMALRVKIQPSFGSASVMRFSELEEIITHMLDQFPNDETTSQMQITSDDYYEDNDRVDVEKNQTPTKPTQSGEIHFVTQSLSTTADYDPDITTTVTPTKRIIDDFLPDASQGGDYASTKLSTSKIVKQIKIE
ncbi:uncharacterized protein [Cicer arietinum]|uniref:uncharacterized protein isoform X4 n=1 Tax=Cicer arietinum TaxID=3827 RepID=UPI003CC5317C